MNVLLASSQIDLRLALEIMFREEPGTDIVGTASEAEGLLALLKTTCPDLLVLDWDLPGRSPARIFTEAKSAASKPTIIVLGTDVRDEHAAVTAGADIFVVKGSPPTDLLEAVRRARSQRRRSARGTQAREE